MIHSDYYEATYSSQAITQLCQIGDIAPTDLETFRNQLEDSAAIYRWENSRYQGTTPSKAAATELSKISRQAARLVASLEALEWDTQVAIEKGAQLDEMRMLSTGKAAPEHPSLVLSLKNEKGDTTGVNLSLPILKAALEGLVNAAAYGEENLQKRSSGKIPDLGLRLWLINIEKIWKEVSNQSFARDVTGAGEPITNAGRFCVAAFQLIEPNYSVSRIMNGMKNLIKERRNSTGKLRGETTP